MLILAPRRPRKLLVIVNPISGSGNGIKIYQNTAAGIFKLANVQTDVKGENSEIFVPKMNILIGPRRKKPTFRCLRTTQAQTSLRIHAD